MNKGTTNSDIQNLWDDYRKGDPYALARIMEIFYADLFHWGMRIHYEREFVKDCLQDVFINLHRIQHKIGKVENVKSYLMVTVKRHMIQELEKQRTIKQVRWPDHAEFAVEFAVDFRLIKEEEDYHTLTKLNTLVNTLPTRQKEIIYLRFYQNLTFDQISVVMQLGKQSVYNLIQKALKTLKNNWVALWLLMAPFLLQ